jgi:Peptidase M15
MSFRLYVRAAKLFGFAAVAILVLAMTGFNSAEARTAPEKSARAEIWRGYGDAGYIVSAKKHRLATVQNKKRSFSSAVKKSGYKIKSAGKASGKKYAALNYGLNDASPPKKSLTGGGVRWVASSSCLNGTLVALVQSVAANYGPVTVSSTCRSHGHNASVGGAKRSQHLTGDAVDFRVHGNYGGVYAYLRSNAGGVHHYGGGLFHADTGPRRTW